MLNMLFGNLFAPQPQNVRMVSPAEIKQWHKAGEAVLIDVREAGEFAAERIPGAINLPLSTFDPAKVPVVPEGKKLVIHCRSGARCGMAAARLAASGFSGDIHRMEGGIMGWRFVGGPTA
ncbi:rhodanese-like domain-containing protein [Magnetospirillum sp. UT-4]|uniref:rhodanese-like domain-containing protein n=1 Tax=Magnetospirillum sp. UT-4 TaxID=2681467 RepID=UPI00137D8780|nr:rhodanese-like domain-containing protein [Magnetospirillum sp. UT-4]CAA7613637.1 Rhodanese-related sulfurtransferase [Magnetospirillum sp. UT-4]